METDKELASMDPVTVKGRINGPFMCVGANGVSEGREYVGHRIGIDTLQLFVCRYFGTFGYRSCSHPNRHLKHSCTFEGVVPFSQVTPIE